MQTACLVLLTNDATSGEILVERQENGLRLVKSGTIRAARIQGNVAKQVRNAILRGERTNIETRTFL
jgi:hypothetical protein